ncbi:hypothetical protein AgCh_006563 [Apium graveolens]
MEVATGEPVRVQTLSQLTKPSQIPSQYIQPPETRPDPHTSSTTTTSIPSISLTRDVTLLRREIGDACRDWGAFHITNHGVPVTLLNDIRNSGRSFFEDLGIDEKMRYSCDSSLPASEGYGSRMLVESNDTVLDWRDYFDHHTLPVSRRNPFKWPESPCNYREVVAEYSDCMCALAQKLLCLISESLGLPSSCIEEAVGEFYQNITVSYYPPCPQPELTLGLQSHSDMGSITLLIQDDVGGLQVLKDGEWVTVHPVSDAIVVILADQTEVITNGQYRSSIHRAITNANRARISVATFHDPAKTRTVSPVINPPRYKQVNYGDYVSSWYTKGPEGKRNIDALQI